MGLFVVGRLAARHGVRVRLRHAQSGGLTALIWLPESVASPESAQPLGRLRKFEADDYGPAPSLSAPTATLSQGPSFSGPAVLPGPGAGAGAPGGLGGAAATASRIPRLGGNGNGGNGNANGGFGAFGGATTAGNGGNGGGLANGGGLGNAGGLGNGGSLGNGRPGANGGSGPTPAINSPGGPLPVRTPGNNPLGQVGNGNGNGGAGNDGAGSGNSVFGGGGDDFGTVSDFGTVGDFGTTRLPARGGSAPSGPIPAAPGNGVAGSDGSQVTIPPAVGGTQDQRLPIFDSLESDWFRRSGTASLSSASAAAPAAAASAVTQAWSSPADEGYRAARAAAAPESDETTTAGLPKRTPRANLVPGSVGNSAGAETESTPPARSAETIRSRMASFQRGVRDARATASQNEEP
jgi:hypothetical protein